MTTHPTLLCNHTEVRCLQNALTGVTNFWHEIVVSSWIARVLITVPTTITVGSEHRHTGDLRSVITNLNSVLACNDGDTYGSRK